MAAAGAAAGADLLIRALGEAVRFLTLLPVPGGGREIPARRDGVSAAFPAVGLLVGGVGAAAGLAAGALWGEALRAPLVVLAWIAVTGGLHWDGLADSCDALFSWRSRERRLEILRDSRLGTMGALGLAAGLVLEGAALHALGPHWWRGALLAPIWGRWAAAWGVARYPAAREEGAGARFRAAARPADAALASMLTLLLTAAVWWPWGPAAGLFAVPAVLVAARAIARSLGGQTGDTLGALCQLAEIAALLALVAAVRQLAAA